MPPASISLFLTVVLLATGHVVAPPGTSPEEAAQLKKSEAVAGEAVDEVSGMSDSEEEQYSSALEHSELSDEVSEEAESTEAVLGKIVKALVSIVKFSQGIEEFDPERKTIMDFLLTSLDYLANLYITVPEAAQTDKQAVEEYLLKSMVPLMDTLYGQLVPEPTDFDMEFEKDVGKILALEALDHLGKLLDKVSENSSYIMELKTLVARMKGAANLYETEKKIIQIFVVSAVFQVAEGMRQLTSELFGNGIASFSKKIDTLAGTMNDKRLDKLLEDLDDNEEHITSNSREAETPAAKKEDKRLNEILEYLELFGNGIASYSKKIDTLAGTMNEGTEEHIPSNTQETETPAAEIKESAQSQTLNEEAVAEWLVGKMTQLAHLLQPENLEDPEERIPSSTTEPETTVAEKEGVMRHIILEVLGLHVLESDSKEFSAERMLLQNNTLENLDALIKEAAQSRTAAEHVVKGELEFILKSWNNITEIESYFEPAQDYLQELWKISALSATLAKSRNIQTVLSL